MSKPKKLRRAYIAYFEGLSDKEFSHYLDLLEDLELEIVYDFNKDEPDVVFFVDGPVINPRMYGEKPLNNIKFVDRERDGIEASLFHRCQHTYPTPLIIGLGERGCNLVNVMCGGKTYQHVYGGMGIEPIKYSLNHPLTWWLNIMNTQIPIPPENGKDKIIPCHVIAETTDRFPSSKKMFRSNAKHHNKRIKHRGIISMWYPSMNALGYLPKITNMTYGAGDLFKQIFKALKSGQIENNATRKEKALEPLPPWSEDNTKDKRCAGCYSCSKDIDCAFFDAKLQGRYPPIEMIRDGSRKHSKAHLMLTHKFHLNDVIEKSTIFKPEELKEFDEGTLEQIITRIGVSEKSLENLDWLHARQLSDFNWSDLVCWGPRKIALARAIIGIMDNRYINIRRLWDFRGQVLARLEAVKSIRLMKETKIVSSSNKQRDAQAPIRLVASNEPEKLQLSDVLPDKPSLSDFRTLGMEFSNPILLNNYLQRQPSGCACCGEKDPFNLRIDEAVVLKGDAPFICGLCAGSLSNFNNVIVPYGVRA